MYAQRRFQAARPARLAVARIVAILLVLLGFGFSGPIEFAPLSAEDRYEPEIIDSPDEYVIPVPPREIERPNFAFEAVDDADPEETISETGFDPTADVPPTPPPTRDAPFVVFDDAPKLLRAVPPEYPGTARDAGIEGRVDLLVVIDERGAVVSVEILRSDASVFDSAALEAVWRWTFVPAQQSGNPVRARIVVPIEFSLDGS